MAYHPETYASMCLALAKATVAPDYSRIVSTILGESGNKTLLVAGAEDKIAPSGANAIHAAIPGAGICVLKEVGHWPQLEALEATSRLLKGFLYDSDMAIIPAKL